VLYAIINFILAVVFGSKVTNDVLDLLNENDYGVNDDVYNLTEDEEEAIERIIKYSVIVSYVLVGVITAFWIYPSVMLITEIRNGIMSRETYPREEFSCCCTDN
jgi:large-conductance mechanosensitive channel